MRILHDGAGKPVLLELRSHKLATVADVVKSVGMLKTRFEEFITYSQYAAVKYKVIHRVTMKIRNLFLDFIFDR